MGKSFEGRLAGVYLERNLIQRGTRIKVIKNFSSETIHARRHWNKVFKFLKENPPGNLEIYMP